jgi:hypothetical protein
MYAFALLMVIASHGEWVPVMVLVNDPRLNRNADASASARQL